MKCEKCGKNKMVDVQGLGVIPCNCSCDLTITEKVSGKIITKKIPFRWEVLEEVFDGDSMYTCTARSKIYGGWMIRNLSSNELGSAESCVFVPDPNHVWEL